jgi:Uma2 family endonuclease
MPDAAWLSVAPDWVCEIVSPSTEGIDRGKKLAIYARERMPHLWIINPVSQVLELLALNEDRSTLMATHVGAVAVRAEPFEVIEVDLAALWMS